MHDIQTGNGRAQVQIVDVFMTFAILVALLVLAPVFYKFTGMVATAADPFTATVLRFFVPMVILALFLSVGISARTGGFR